MTKIVLDLKNLALYNGGIAHWLNTILLEWVKTKSSDVFIGIAPQGKDTFPVVNPSIVMEFLAWPAAIPRQLRHIFYDLWFFPRYVNKAKPTLLFSPYHDVQIPPKRSKIYSVITVHDLCFFEVPKSYPWVIGFYYRTTMRANLLKADHILTVSEATREKIVQSFHVSPAAITVIPNAISNAFLDYLPRSEDLENWRIQHGERNSKILLYTGGIEYRKNISRFLLALRQLRAAGNQIVLCFTGQLPSQWKHLFEEDELKMGKVRFLGRLTLTDLRIAYSAADGVVYPSLCEGFGRACIEAMVCGTPLACSSLDVFREVAGDYAQYFDPYDIGSIAEKIQVVLNTNKKLPQFDSRYQLEQVQKQFVFTMSKLTETARQLSSEDQV